MSKTHIPIQNCDMQETYKSQELHSLLYYAFHISWTPTAFIALLECWYKQASNCKRKIYTISVWWFFTILQPCWVSCNEGNVWKEADYEFCAKFQYANLPRISTMSETLANCKVSWTFDVFWIGSLELLTLLLDIYQTFWKKSQIIKLSSNWLK